METKNKKTFDAVQMIRDAREKVSFETQNMNFAELKKYIQDQINDSKLKAVEQ